MSIAVEMLNLNVRWREGVTRDRMPGTDGTAGICTLLVYFVSSLVLISWWKSWCNNMEAMATVNILTQQVQTIGTFFAKKGERLCFWELEISIISSCRSSRAALSFPPNAPSRDRDTSWFQEWDGRRLPFDLLALWISSRTSLSGPAGLGKGWKTFRPTSLTRCCGAIPCLSIVVSAKWTFVCQQVVCGGVPNVLFSWAATQVYFWRRQMGGGWV